MIVLAAVDPVFEFSEIIVEGGRESLEIRRTEKNLMASSSLYLSFKNNPEIQSDVFIRGASFKQTSVFLEGVRLYDPQTGHFTADLPLPVDAIQSINIVTGPVASTFGTGGEGGF